MEKVEVSMIRAIALDAFDTIVKITDRRNPYAQLFEAIGIDRSQSRLLALTRRSSLEDLAHELASGPVRRQVQQILPQLLEDLQAELRSIRPFPEAISVMQKLKDAGFVLAIISNLAQPYTNPIRALFAELVDTFVFSSEVGAIKPQGEIFLSLSQALQLEPQKILVVGNSKTNDFDGARAMGMSALHLDRSGKAHLHPTIATLEGILDYLLA